MSNQEGSHTQGNPVHHRTIHSNLSEYHHSYGLYSSSSSSLASSTYDITTGESASTTSLSSSIIAKRWLTSRFRLTVESLRAERVCWVKFGSAVVNFTNSILGAGLMGIPYAMSRAGLVPGVIILVLIAFISGSNDVYTKPRIFLRLVGEGHGEERQGHECYIVSGLDVEIVRATWLSTLRPFPGRLCIGM